MESKSSQSRSLDASTSVI
uniref:Uncharacterized protein n=1 Tax=Medicago truncatula TaxID=3880 RepID=I3T2J9_MEDTR|nr:unknown [Medicago truncatula]